MRGTGLDAHHIIEQRLVKHLGFNTDEMLAVAVTKSEHQAFTNAWRNLIGHGYNYSELTLDDLWEYAQIVYENYPELKEAAYKTLFG